MSKVVVFDAGHSLVTAGKQTMNGKYGIVKEWEINDKVLRKAKEILERDYTGITIYRTDDVTGKSDISLNERVRRCNSYNPALFISFHHKAGGGTGTEVYWHTYGTAEDKKVASILAPKLASKCGMRNRGVKQNQLGVLNCKATAILVEGGFMDTKSDYEYICSDKGQQAYAEAVVETVVEYLGLAKKPVQTQPSQPSTSSTFKAKIICDSLNIRKEASFDSKIMGTVKKGEVFTIVEEKNGLGKLKSGAGWISMGSKYVQKM